MRRCCGEHFDWCCDLHDHLDLSRDSLDRGWVLWKCRLHGVELDVAVTGCEPRCDDDHVHHVTQSVRGRSVRDDHRDCFTCPDWRHCRVHCGLDDYWRMRRCCGEHFDWGCDLHNDMDRGCDARDRGWVLWV